MLQGPIKIPLWKHDKKDLLSIDIRLMESSYAPEDQCSAASSYNTNPSCSSETAPPTPARKIKDSI